MSFSSYRSITLGCVLFHVIPQIFRMSARVIAYLAGNWLLSSVGKHVPPQLNCLSARENALIASKRLFTSMLPQVSLEMTSIVA